MSESAIQQYERLRHRKFRPLEKYDQSLEQIVQNSAVHNYTLVSSCGNNPRIIIYGMTHYSQGTIDQEEDLLSTLSKVINSNDIIAIEGEECEVLPNYQSNTLDSRIYQILTDRTPRLIFNDSQQLIAQKKVNDYKLSTATEQERENLTKTDLDICAQRDHNFCYNPYFGILPFLRGDSKNHKQLNPDKKMIQILGMYHLASGIVEEILQKENISYALFVPNEFIKENHLRELSDFREMDQISRNWISITNELGYIGRKKGINSELDKRFGHRNWARGFMFDQMIVPKSIALQQYEDAYVNFLTKNNSVLDWLTNTASEVYDIDPSNINSGLDYSIQECEGVHFQDISIRRALKRLGRIFKGDHLVQIRGHESEGYLLNPGQVPFHKAELILPSNNNNWWKPDSIEAFYQQNKVLLVNPDNFIVKKEIIGQEGTIMYRYNKQIYYRTTENKPQVLELISGRLARRMTHEDKSYRVIKNEEFKPYSSYYTQN